jgi:hypothetical protein
VFARIYEHQGVSRIGTKGTHQLLPHSGGTSNTEIGSVNDSDGIDEPKEWQHAPVNHVPVG